MTAVMDRVDQNVVSTTTTNMNARSMYERKMQTQFANEQSRMAYEDSVTQDRRLRGNAKSEDRVDHKRRQRLQAEMAAERQAEAQLRQRELNNKHRTFVEQEEKLATEMERRRRVQLREELELQKIRNESEEIRDLEQKLRSAYLAKERAKQIEEKQNIAENEKHVQALMDLQVDADRLRAQKAEEDKQRRKMEDNLASRAVLDRQMAEQQQAKQRAFEEFVREKKMVDDIVAKIQDEAHQEELMMMKKRKETREYVQSYLQEREAWKEAERRRVQLEDEAIANYVEAVRQREAGWAEKKAALEAEKEKIFQKISDEVTRQRQEQEEMLDLQIELANQEAEDRYIEAEKERMERRIRSRLEMMAANEKQKAMKKEQNDKDAAEEEEFRQRMLAKFAEDERLEQMNAQKRRMKQLEHRRAVEKLLEDRRAMYEAEKAREMEEQVAEQQRQEARANLIERERQRILAEHAQRLGLENLPRGLLSKVDDLKFFNKNA